MNKLNTNNMPRNFTPETMELIYNDAFAMVDNAIKNMQNMYNVSGDCSPALDDEFEQARQRFIDVLIKQVIENLTAE